jgi:hypothetical protein
LLGKAVPPEVDAPDVNDYRINVVDVEADHGSRVDDAREFPDGVTCDLT